MRHLIFSYIHT